jgi:hypothetical protein
MDTDSSEFLENLEFCNRERFNGMLMLANRTIHEFAVFVSQAIFDEKSDAYRFVHTQKDIYPMKDRENEFVIWSRLFKRYYEQPDRDIEDMEKRKNQESK